MKNTLHNVGSLFARPSSHPRRRFRLVMLTTALLLLLLATGSTAFADSATWRANPSSGDWNTAANWMPNTVPNGAADTATFANSNTTDVSFSADTEVNGIGFNASANAFTITASSLVRLTISGVGITNNSGIAQNFEVPGDETAVPAIQFTNSAAAGSLTMFTNNGSAVSFLVGGVTTFSGSSTADHGTFTNNGGTVPNAGGGWINFDVSSTAGNGTFINNGGAVSGAFGGLTFFFGSSTAGNGTFTNNGNTVNNATGGQTQFLGTSTAGNATLIANGGLSGGAGGIIRFYDDSTGGTARVEVFGNGNLHVTASQRSGLTIGSLEGNGDVFVGEKNLRVGSNNLSTTFSGVIFGKGGSLTKVGTGILVLGHANSYTGGTTIKGGNLWLTMRAVRARGPAPCRLTTASSAARA
jgi:autotransporter-associated beta strand protein